MDRYLAAPFIDNYGELASAFVEREGLGTPFARQDRLGDGELCSALAEGHGHAARDLQRGSIQEHKCVAAGLQVVEADVAFAVGYGSGNNVIGRAMFEANLGARYWVAWLC